MKPDFSSDTFLRLHGKPARISSMFLLLFILGWCVFASRFVLADSVMPLPSGGENIMVTFDEVDEASFPWTYRGVTYTAVQGNTPLIWSVPGLPITRFVKSPMLAMTTADEEFPDDPANPMSLRLDFDQPTQFFGFSLGFNSRPQSPDGSLLPNVGSVALEYSDGASQVFPLSASRVLCCTETRFDYSDNDDGIGGNGLVKTATITLAYNFEPFFPGSGFPGDYFSLKFMGIDDVTYSTGAVPVPAAIWLFGSGLLGMVAIGRRKRTA